MVQNALFYIGVLQLTVLFLSVFAGIISIRMFHLSKNKNELRAWKYLMIVLLLFAIEELIGILDAFDILRSINFMRHLLPSVIIGFIIVAALKQREVLK